MDLKEYLQKKQFKVKEPIEFFIFEKKVILLAFVLFYIQFYMENNLFTVIVKILIFVYILNSFKNNYIYLCDIKKGINSNLFSKIYTFFMKRVYNKERK